MKLADIAAKLAKAKLLAANPQVAIAIDVLKRISGFLLLARLRSNFQKWNREGADKSKVNENADSEKRA